MKTEAEPPPHPIVEPPDIGEGCGFVGWVGLEGCGREGGRNDGSSVKKCEHTHISNAVAFNIAPL